MGLRTLRPCLCCSSLTGLQATSRLSKSKAVGDGCHHQQSSLLLTKSPHLLLVPNQVRSFDPLRKACFSLNPAGKSTRRSGSAPLSHTDISVGTLKRSEYSSNDVFCMYNSVIVHKQMPFHASFLQLPYWP